MAFDYTRTYELLYAVESLQRPSCFLRDRYFPTNVATDIFRSHEVLIEYRDGKKKLAPFVAPRKGGVTMLRHGSHLERFEPPNIAPKRPLTLDELDKRGFGEALFSNLPPQERESLLILKDYEEMDDAISRREEAIAAEIMLTNKCIMYHVADDWEKGDEVEIRFYEDANPAVYTPSVDWSDSDAPISEDVDNMARFLTSRGLGATELVCGVSAGKSILRNNEIRKLLDLKNFNFGEVDPMPLPTGAVRLARLILEGRKIDIITYEEEYEDDDGDMTPYIPHNAVVLTSPACGHTLYGAVKQMEVDKQYHVHAASRVPKYIADPNTDSRELRVTAKPLLVPHHKHPWISASVQER